MANKVIADLTALTGVASNDALPISDTSDASEAKKVTVTELFTNTVITTPTVNGGVLANNTIHNPTPTGNWDGWTWATDTWTAVDANTVSINSDFTATLQLGDKLKLINDSTTKYFYIITTPAWSGTATTFDVTGEVDLVAGSITPRYSHQENPFGFKNGVVNYKALAYRVTSDQSLTDAGTTKVQLNAESYDINSNFDSTTNYRYTAPISGYYQISGSAFITGATALANVAGYFYKNGSVLSTFGQAYISSFVQFRMSGSSIRYLAKGDYIEMFIYADDTGNTPLAKVGSDNTFMSIQFISI